MKQMASNEAKRTPKMTGYLFNIWTYFEAVIHPAAGKGEVQKVKRRSNKPSYSAHGSPDSLNMRANVRAQNAVRRNPAP